MKGDMRYTVTVVLTTGESKEYKGLTYKRVVTLVAGMQEGETYTLVAYWDKEVP